MMRRTCLLLSATPLMAVTLGCHAGPSRSRTALPTPPAPIGPADASGSDRVLFDQMRRMAVEDAAARR